MKPIALAALLLALGSPVLAGGGTGTFTSYDRPQVRVITEPGVVVSLAGFSAPDCCCGSQLQTAMNVATGTVVRTEGSVRRMYVWTN